MERLVLEKDILKSCLNKLDTWQRQKVVVHFDRINSGGMAVGRHYIRLAKKGTPDIIAYINHGNICHVLFIECKRKGGIWPTEQREFEMAFRIMTNAHYILVTDPLQVDRKIEEITSYYKNQLDSI